MDSGFLDHYLLRALNEKGVSTTIPARKNMDIYQTAVSVALQEDEWTTSKDKKYAYAVILCTNANLSAREIIANYETGWGCEEDDRQ